MAGSDDYPRSHRVADFIQRELAGMIRTEIRDPRISPMLTIASVEVSRDLAVAKVYWSVLDPEERAETKTALKSAAGFLRRRLAQEMQIRAVPELRFHHDDSAERGAKMSALIDRAMASNTTEADAGAGAGGASADELPAGPAGLFGPSGGAADDSMSDGADGGVAGETDAAPADGDSSPGGVREER